MVAAAGASSASSRARSSATWLNALRAKMKATMAITSEKKSNGVSNIKPPGDRPGFRAFRVKFPSESLQRRPGVSAGRVPAGPAPAAPAAPRGGSETARRAVRPSVSTSRRSVRPARRPPPTCGKFCLCRCRPEIASTVRCNSVSVNSGGKSSNTTGRYLSLARNRPIAVARIRRWSKRIEAPSRGGDLRANAAGRPSRRASSINPAS